MIEQMINWLTILVEKMGYGGVALSMFIESFFVPIPSELLMPFAGFIAAQGKMNIIILILIGGISSYFGTLPFYFLGFWGNKLVVDNFLKKYGRYFFISEEDVDKGFEIFGKYGNVIVLIGRVIPIIRSVISFPAGVTKMNFTHFSLYTLIGSTLWSAILALLGYKLGENWNIIGDYINQYEKIILGIGVLLVLAFITLRLTTRKK